MGPSPSSILAPSDLWLGWAAGQRADVREDLRLDLEHAGVRCVGLGAHTLTLDRPEPGPLDARFTLALARITDGIVQARSGRPAWDAPVERLGHILDEAMSRGHHDIADLLEIAQVRLARRRARWAAAAESWWALREGALSDEELVRAATT